MRRMTAWQRLQLFGRQHEWHLHANHDVAKSVEQTKSVRTQQWHAERPGTFGWWRLPTTLIYFAATQRQSGQTLAWLKSSAVKMHSTLKNVFSASAHPLYTGAVHREYNAKFDTFWSPYPLSQISEPQKRMSQISGNHSRLIKQWMSRITSVFFSGKYYK